MDSRLDTYQNALLKKSLPLSERVVEAYYAYPRHLFLTEYSHEEAYEDDPLSIFEKPPFVSAASQPSLVLRILDLMEFAEGQRVFELGSGSGWNAALISYLIGKSGQLITTEIIPEVAQRAQKILRERHVTNVKVLNVDGFDGLSAEGPFDRIILTAGSTEFPLKLFNSLNEGGLMAFVHKRVGFGDFLELIKKHDHKPEVKISIPCNFESVVRDNGIAKNKESRLQDGTL
ncbi:protein-L-isoaspartate O-methyltransferase family protein [Bdellovibrio svalbardensis]|uniref:Protein-L-isoaspartate O-methyltransferase n=1 Tax=Bdellovibrio svalbardensis TaxID=2972972 RepID=A0ABT6DHM8_9BACT|nr:protein-L-isoaspartate O-methyltransferase [Bdellovibrio svalbardensis]MDG0816009.1 protein-L-isoaspartate O-methyltransferase [Bdellovibrio svalbardensis]